MSRWRKALPACRLAACVPALVAFAAQAAGHTSELTVPVIVSAAAERGPLNSFMITPSSVNCVQGRLAIGADGTVGVVAPVVGPTVLRGSLDLETVVTWRVVDLDSLGPEALQGLAHAYTVCTRTR